MAAAARKKRKTGAGAVKPRRVPTYSFRPGYRARGSDPAAVAAELDRIRRRDGAVRTEVVVDEARPADSPLHAEFTWDDGEAAREYRLIEARQLIRAVVVTYPSEEPRSVYVHVRTEDDAGYQPMSVVVRDGDMLAAAQAELVSRLEGARRSLRELGELAAAAKKTDGVRRAEAAGRHVEAAVGVLKRAG